MTASDTRPDGIPLPDLSERRMRPRDRRVVQAIALVCAMAAMLVIPWADETDLMRDSLKPPEKVTALPEGRIGELVGAKWKVLDRRTAAPLGDRQSGGDVVELRLKLAVRPSDAASAKAVGSYGLRYRFHDGDGRVWFAVGLRTAEPKAGVAMGITVKATVPRAKADELELHIQAPKETRKPGGPLASLRFSR
ncbi:hypothetical protein HUT06_05770 [Actinomadura sp. NAK00032]|uniref:hypothetical protein n=1 Tax=Actinomadura sp. NAK00032 TaxID=2742128 RepID=UPI0015900DD3|nr:hypothetical protein [Actinomadura sp. NAK00032]QKW33596.1 hypothetical protein HUT06_05770 [Actinomadura sp. NAK00032]